jgi:hypothetical protein
MKVFELIQVLTDKITKFIIVHGLEGIGKARLVYETAKYLNKRNFFRDGIFYIDLKGVRSY